MGTFDEIQSNYNYHYAVNGSHAKKEHGHDFCEFFLNLNDNVLHIINGKKQILHAGMLVFIRPGDRHRFDYHNGVEPRHINLGFRQEIAERFFVYLGRDGEGIRRLLMDAPMPPVCVLSDRERQHVLTDLNRFSSIDTHMIEELQLTIYFFVSEIFSLYVKKLTKKKDAVPDAPPWLEDVCEKMERYENFTEGLPRMVALSGKTREHVSRSMQKYKNTTVSAFINNLRLEHAANMLVNSDMHVTDICFESGFQSIDHFGKLFRKKYGVSPSGFRDMMQTGNRQ